MGKDMRKHHNDLIPTFSLKKEKEWFGCALAFFKERVAKPGEVLYLMAVITLFSLFGCNHPAKVDIGELVEALNALDADEVSDEDGAAEIDIIDKGTSDDEDCCVTDPGDFEYPVVDDAVVADEDVVEAEADLLTETEVEDDLVPDLSDEDESEADVVPDEDSITQSGVLCTGQTKCYSDTVEMACQAEGSDFYGQDPQYALLDLCIPQNYTITGLSGTDVVTDNNTGLIWQRTLPVTYAGCSGDTGKRCTWQEAVDYCNNLTYADQEDWRLPTRKELATLLNYGYFMPSIDQDTFPYTVGDAHWSSSSNVLDNNYAWRVSFFAGYMDNNQVNKTSAEYVRCTRGSATLNNSNFTENTIAEKVVVIDIVTGLIWTKEYSDPLIWKDALNYCEESTYAGYDDWRLPNINELATLLNDAIHDPASDFPEMPSYNFWTSSTHKTSTSVAYRIDFGTSGRVYYNGKENANYVRCVRNAL
ncbi:MAG TPA: DUF1566 domain-containing protein [bacterium]|nr:DUF1566 domain-containing protein [bacterium]